jgi:hypothetical protein
MNDGVRPHTTGLRHGSQSLALFFLPMRGERVPGYDFAPTKMGREVAASSPLNWTRLRIQRSLKTE